MYLTNPQVKRVLMNSFKEHTYTTLNKKKKTLNNSKEAKINTKTQANWDLAGGGGWFQGPQKSKMLSVYSLHMKTEGQGLSW